ncbi:MULTISPECIES: helix-turn-helix transcriptional regulator [unclassified Streptomyces]|uniref:helix-turn-helix domain-containing protein n=1 Tax=unclassified Streptomyces TaxID=2593676 RepID=UPI0013A6EFF6|nr:MULTISPECIES: helix-turn-helix transcriptional regulator [unclassified Streptomyces]
MNRPQRRIEIPHAAVTMVINFGDPVRVGEIGTEATSYSSLINGLRTTAVIGEHTGQLHGMEVHFTPWMAYTLFGTDMHELRNRTVSLVELLGPAGHRLEDQLARAPSWQARFTLLDLLLLSRRDAGRAAAPQVVWAWGKLVRTDGRIPLSELMKTTEWSARHLELKFREQIGQPPKTVSRVLRIQRALRMLTSGGAAADVASSCGFYDQAHLHRDFRAMTGFTPRKFLIARSGGDRPVDRVPGQVTSTLA